MEARFCRIGYRPVHFVSTLVVLIVVAGCARAAEAAVYKTANFVVTTQTPELAKEIGDAAEIWRKQLALEWLGQEMPGWSRPCPITARVAARMGAGGQTSFTFDGGQVFGWNMSIQGSRERILDSVLPHEITHTIFASHFREPLPRWADEGACTTVEHQSEIAIQERKLIEYLKTKRGIAFSEMFAMTEYPPDVLPLYAQGHSVSQWLIESRGRREFLAFLSDGMKDNNWPRSVDRHYGFSNLGTMQGAWLEWVKSGRPRLTPETSPIARQMAQREGVALASANGPDVQPANAGLSSQAAIYRGQNPDEVTPIPAAASPAGANVVSPSPTTNIVTTSGSVYATTAAKAESARAQGFVSAEPGSSSAAAASGRDSSSASVYDASREMGLMRR